MPAEDHVGDQFDTFYHLTDKRKFKPNPKQVPADNAMSISPRSSPGLFVADNPHGVEHWWNAHQYHRAYVAEIKVPKGLAQEERWGGEKFIPGEHLNQAQVSRVIPSDAHVRETYGEPGWIEENEGKAFDTGESLSGGNASNYGRFTGYRYEGPDARDFTPEQHAGQMKRVRSYRKWQADPRNH